MTLVDLIRLIDARGPLAHPGQRDELASFARQLLGWCDAAWTATSEAGARADELTEAYERGKAHVLCELLGDQELLHLQVERTTT